LNFGGFEVAVSQIEGVEDGNFLIHHEVLRPYALVGCVEDVSEIEIHLHGDED